MATDPDCVFCRIVAGELPATRIDEDDRALAFLDVNPGTRGHALVVPKEHAADVLEVSEEDLHACASMARRLARRLRARLGADGINVLTNSGPAAWQTVGHFHMHVIPRYEGDPLQLPWVPTPADPGTLAEIAEALRA